MQLIVLLLVLIFVLLCVLVFGLLYIKNADNDNSKKQDEILKRQTKKAKQCQWFRVHYASDKRFRLWRKVFVWETSGILFIDTKGISFHYLSDANSESVIHFEPGRFQLNWIGVKFFPNGGMPWFCLMANNQRHYFTADSGMTILNALRLTNDIYNQIRLVFPGLEASERISKSAGFALEKNRFSLMALGLIFLLGLYALVDYMLNLEVFVVPPGVMQIILLSLLVVAISYLVLQKGNIPRIESLGLAVLLGVGFGLATPPALLRLNQLTDENGLQTYQYILDNELKLIPLENQADDIPVINFSDNKEYWAHYAENSQHEISLRKGGLGFYQINMRPIYERMREYYTEKHNTERLTRPTGTKLMK